MADPSDAEARSREELVVLLRAAVLHGFHEGIDNHVSAMVPGTDDRFLLNPFGPHWSELRPDDLLLIGIDGRRLSGDGDAETTAFHIHARLHRARPGARAVVHTHVPYATAIACTPFGLDTRLSQNAARYHGRVARVSYEGRAEDDTEGDRLAAAVSDDTRVLLLDNHGVIVVAESVEHAWHDLYFLERAAQVQVLAMSSAAVGGVVSMGRKVAARTARQFDDERRENAPLLFAAERRRVARENPI